MYVYIHINIILLYCRELGGHIMCIAQQLLSLKFRQRGFAELSALGSEIFYRPPLPRVAENKNVNPLAAKKMCGAKTPRQIRSEHCVV